MEAPQKSSSQDSHTSRTWGVFWLAGIFCSIVGVDQYIKHLVVTSGEPFICNTGIAFGIELPRIFLYPIWTIFLFFLISLIWTHRTKKPIIIHELPFVLILAGGLSNLYDRATVGCVVDYISIGDWFYVFNIADSAISVGGALLLLFILFPKTLSRF